MQERDHMLKAMDKSRSVRVWLAASTNLVEEARWRHGLTPTATAALGRVLTATAMVGLDLKGSETVTVRINGGGPLGTILAVSDSEGCVRGYVQNPNEDVPEISRGKLNVGAAVGTDGYLDVTKDLGLKTPFVGSVDLVSGEIAEDFAHYFTYSEQKPSLVALGVMVERDCSVAAAGGVIFQAMPGASDDILSQVEENMLALGPVSTAIKEHDTLKEVMDQIMAGIEYDIVGDHDICFQCRCSRDKVVGIVRALSDDDIKKALEEQGRLEICCNFCNETYYVEADELAGIRGHD